MKILIASTRFAENSIEPLDILKLHNIEIVRNNFNHRLTADEIIQYTKDCDGIIAGLEEYNSHVLQNISVKVISRIGIGMDNIDLENAEELGITVKNTPDAPIQAVAEHTIAFIFDILKNLTFHTKNMNSGKWQQMSSQLLKTQQIGIIGLGKIGREVCDILETLGVSIIAYDPFPPIEWLNKHETQLYSLDNVLAGSDIISIHVSSIESKPFKLDISKMKHGVSIINTSRGYVIDETELYDALKCGKVHSAALDVFTDEPYHGRFTELDNVILTPHVASNTIETRIDMEVQAVKNLVEELEK